LITLLLRKKNTKLNNYNVYKYISKLQFHETLVLNDWHLMIILRNGNNLQTLNFFEENIRGNLESLIKKLNKIIFEK